MNGCDIFDMQFNVLVDFDFVLLVDYQEVDYFMFGNFILVVQLWVLDQFKKCFKLIVFDIMNFWMDIVLEEFKIVFKCIDVLMINDEEVC